MRKALLLGIALLAADCRSTTEPKAVNCLDSLIAPSVLVQHCTYQYRWTPSTDSTRETHRMADTKGIDTTNAGLQRMRSALAILGNRRMANLSGDLKVARLLRHLAPLTEPLDGLKRTAMLALIDKLPEGSTLTPTQEQILSLRLAEVQADVEKEAAHLDVPVAFVLTQADLPKEATGADGWKNAAQIGAVVADLGELYHDGEPTEAVKA